MTNQVPIDESTKVAALLGSYPELEDVLIGIAPPFKKLRNPVLRRSVAKVATLRQAAAVARMSAVELVNRLRAEVGQPPIGEADSNAATAYLGSRPEWFDTANVVESIEEQSLPDDGPMPLVTLLKRANELKGSEIIELRSNFLPAPGIDAMSKKGFLVWTKEAEPGKFRTYFRKPMH